MKHLGPFDLICCAMKGLTYQEKSKDPLLFPSRSARFTFASTPSPSSLFNVARRTGTLSSPSRSRLMSEALPLNPDPSHSNCPGRIVSGYGAMEETSKERKYHRNFPRSHPGQNGPPRILRLRSEDRRRGRGRPQGGCFVHLRGNSLWMYIGWIRNVYSRQ